MCLVHLNPATVQHFDDRVHAGESVYEGEKSSCAIDSEL